MRCNHSSIYAILKGCQLRWLFISLAFLVLFSSCINNKLHNQTAIEEQNKLIVLKWLEEVNKDNYEQLFMELWAKDSKQLINSNSDTMDYDHFKNLLQWLYAEVPVITHEVHEIIAKGDKVTVFFSAKATHDVESFGVPPTGRELEWNAIAIYEISEGKIQTRWEVADILSLYEQLGMELQMKETTEY
jgi:predicted ester cyclase